MDRLNPPAAQNREVYDRYAQEYDRSRSQDFVERGWVDRALADVPSGGAVLDLGCGAGAPTMAYLCKAGFAVTGVDFAPAMLELAARRCPGADLVEQDIATLDLPKRFDAIIGWGSFFHLTPDAQRGALPKIAAHLAPGGRLLLTVGPEAGEVTGTVAGQSVYHASLSESEYRSILWISGCVTDSFTPNDPECAGHSLLLAQRTT